MYRIIGGDQKEYGPVTVDQVKEWIAQGRANGESLVLPEGSTAWVRLASLPEFSLLSTSIPPLTTAAAPPQYAGDVPSYLLPSILLTLCCCPPPGIVAIVFAAQVSSRLAEGDYEGARRASANARLWCILAVVAGFLSTVGLIWM